MYKNIRYTSRILHASHRSKRNEKISDLINQSFKFALLFIFFLTNPSVVKTSELKKDFQLVFSHDYPVALDFVRQNKQELISHLNHYNAQPHVAIPVIFPEILRYSLLRDKIETSGLKIFYINLGQDYANFSIGLFQMKPSFVERIEKYIKKGSLGTEFIELYIYPDTSSAKSIRSERISRLEDETWQLKYLACFITIVENKYSEKQWKSIDDKIRFFATAYNSGFWLEENVIRKQMKKKYFPNGKHSLSRRYNYSDISVFFYNKNWKKMLDGDH
jgi:hypothetical protein